jgi:hypothetical protein
MRHRLYPTDLTNSQGKLIKEGIPLAKPGGRPRALDMRKVINARVYARVYGGVGRAKGEGCPGSSRLGRGVSLFSALKQLSLG